MGCMHRLMAAFVINTHVLYTSNSTFSFSSFPLSHRYNRDYVVEGEPYAGYDRHNAEVAAFHLDRCVSVAIRVSVIISSCDLSL